MLLMAAALLETSGISICRMIMSSIPYTEYACQHQPTSRAMSSTRPTARGLHDVGPHAVTGQEWRAWQEEIFQLHQELAVLGTYETNCLCLVYWSLQSRWSMFCFEICRDCHTYTKNTCVRFGSQGQQTIACLFVGLTLTVCTDVN